MPFATQYAHRPYSTLFISTSIEFSSCVDHSLRWFLTLHHCLFKKCFIGVRITCNLWNANFWQSLLLSQVRTVGGTFFFSIHYYSVWQNPLKISLIKYENNNSTSFERWHHSYQCHCHQVNGRNPFLPNTHTPIHWPFVQFIFKDFQYTTFI